MRCLLASESEESAMASADSYFDILENTVNAALESIRDGVDIEEAIGYAIDSECIWDVDRQTVAENFGTLDIDAAFSDAYEDFYNEIYQEVEGQMSEEDEEEDEEDEE